MKDVLPRAHEFIFIHARLLERRIFETRFESAPTAGVERAVAAYQNDDGGFGHALEPDLRCPTSQPIFVEAGLAALEEVGCRSPSLAESACAYLRGLSGPAVLVPAIREDALEHPHAAHWKRSHCEPELNPSLGLCGLLHFHGVADDWLTRLSDLCVEQLGAQMPGEAHTLLGASRLAAHLPDRAQGGRILEAIADALPRAEFFVAETPVRSYGLTPLHFAPQPDAPLRPRFPAASIEAHLDDLLGRQQDDGGWPIAWEAPGPAATCEWRARVTLDAIGTLAAYGVIPSSD